MVSLLTVEALISPHLLALLTSWGLEMRSRGVNFSVVGDAETTRYLDRMGFQESIGAQALGVNRNVEAGRFIPLFFIDSSTSQTRAVDAACPWQLIRLQLEKALEATALPDRAGNGGAVPNLLVHRALHHIAGTNSMGMPLPSLPD